MSITSLNFLNKNVKYLELWGNEKDKEGKHLGGEGISPIVSWPSFSLSCSVLDFVLWWSCFTSFNDVVPLSGQLAAMCPKHKHLKHFVFEVLVGDLGVEGFWVETFGLEVGWFEKFEGEVFVEMLFASFLEDL